MDYLPVFVDLNGRTCLLVGGGNVALRKARLLQRAGAAIRVVAPQINEELSGLLADAGHQCLRREARIDDLDGCQLLLAASDDHALNRRLATAAEQRGILANVADDPAHCTFILPSIVDRAPLIVAVSSSGRAPLLARRLRADLERQLPSAYGGLAAFLGDIRASVKASISDPDDRRHFWEDLLDGPLPEQVMAGQLDTARQLLKDALRQARPRQGEVWLVGAGPGDPDLLTIKAFRLMQRADVVLFDRLVSDAVMTLVRADAERIYVGKRPREHTLPQQEIGELMVTLAGQGRRVLRLKGGDPFLFGRGGEEIEQLAVAGIPFQVVPGITAATGCAAYAGIPLTHRDHAQSVRFLTGHLRGDRVNLDWTELVQPQQTLVFYMGSTGLREICEQLVTHGLPPTTPVAVVEQGTTPTQRVTTAQLATLPALVAANPVRAPALIIVGGVVGLRDRLAWYRDSQGS